MSSSYSKSSCNAAVLKFMENANRPYDLKEICSKMGSEYDKTAIQKSLEYLSTFNKISMKTYSKVNIYCAVQLEVDKDLEHAEILKIDQETKTLQDQFTADKKKLAEIETELKLDTKEVSMEDAQAQVAELEKVVAELQAQVDKSNEGNVVKVSVDDQQKIIKDHELYSREYRKRKRLCNDLLDGILDAYPNTKKMLIEEIGLETDEDYKFVPPN